MQIVFAWAYLIIEFINLMKRTETELILVWARETYRSNSFIFIQVLNQFLE